MVIWLPFSLFRVFFNSILLIHSGSQPFRGASPNMQAAGAGFQANPPQSSPQHRPSQPTQPTQPNYKPNYTSVIGGREDKGPQKTFGKTYNPLCACFFNSCKS